MKIYLSIAIMALTVYAVRLFPFLLLRRPVRNRFFKSFLYYVPYVTLAVMTFPAILGATSNPLAGAIALAAGVATAWFSGNLFLTAIICCMAVFIAGLF